MVGLLAFTATNLQGAFENMAILVCRLSPALLFRGSSSSVTR